MADALDRRVNGAVVSLSGNEALLEGLETAPAQTLLDWGITCAKNILAETPDMTDAAADEYAQARLRALRQMLRQVKLMTTARFSPDLVPAAAFLDQVIAQAVTVYGGDFRPPGAEDRTAFLDQALTTQPEFILAARQWLESFL
ncbi:MAG: hypothetical protein AB1531_12170 [Chloroflexota bacterium]